MLQSVNILFLGNGGKSMETKKLLTTKDMTLAALFTALIVVCAWISVPFTVPFTLQTFAVLTAAGLLGAKKGTFSVLLYVLLGAVGLPVFAGFKGGIAALLGPTGGYIIGFLFTAFITGLIIDRFGKSLKVVIPAMILGMIICYIFGTAWFMYVYTQTKEAVSLMTVLGWCIFPFLIPDGIKLALSAIVVNRLKEKI